MQNASTITLSVTQQSTAAFTYSINVQKLAQNLLTARAN